MLKFNRILWIGAWCVLLAPSASVHAQLRGGVGADRPGIGGRISARRDDRANRTAPPPPPAIAAAAAAAAARAAQLSAPRTNNPPGVGASAANSLPRNNPPTGNPLTGNATVGNAAVGNRATGNPLTGNAAPGNVRISNYAANNGANYGGSYGANYPAMNPNAPGGLPNVSAGAYPNPVVQAAASAVPDVNRSYALPPNRLPYTGPGVLIRVPQELRGEVNYLVDDREQLVVHSGEEQLLRLKGSYEVRFSRGVTGDGRSYGEARYTIREGIYRFDVSDNGWELYREAEGSELVRRLEELRQREMRAGSDSSMAQLSGNLGEDPSLESKDGSLPPAASAPLAPSPTSDLRRPVPPPLPLPASAELRSTADEPREPAATQANSEETLPAPRSILEPN